MRPGFTGFLAREPSAARREEDYFPPPGAGCYNRSMRMFRRRPRQPKYGPKILQMRLADSPYGYSVNVRPLGRDRPRVFLQIAAMTTTGGAGCYLTEDEARSLAQALLDGIEQSKALTAREPG
jgi:hypothetical protein